MTIRYTPYPKTIEEEDERNKINIVDLGHTMGRQRILCPLHVVKPLMTFYEEKRVYHCSSCGNIMSADPEENKKPLLYEDEQITFITDPYSNRNMKSGGESMIKAAYSLTPAIKREGIQSIESVKPKREGQGQGEQGTYESLGEAARD